MRKIMIGKSEVIGYGKIILNSITDINLPHLHFLVFSGNDGIEVLNIEFGLMADGSTVRSSISDLVEMLAEFIDINVKKHGYDMLVSIARKTNMEEYWSAYREIDFELAKTSQDLGHKIYEKIAENARKEIMEKYGLLAQIALSEAA